MFERVYVAVMINAAKQYIMSADMRVSLLKKITADKPNVDIVASDGLTANLALKLGAGVLVRGVRGAFDFDYETQIAQANRAICGIDTVFLLAYPEHAYISSSLVMDIVKHSGDISELVPKQIIQDILSAVGRES